MKNGLPTIYWAFRWGWSALHLVILGILLTILLVWAFTDHQGADAIMRWWAWIDRIRYTLSHVLRYPWQ